MYVLFNMIYCLIKHKNKKITNLYFTGLLIYFPKSHRLHVKEPQIPGRWRIGLLQVAGVIENNGCRR